MVCVCLSVCLSVCLTPTPCSTSLAHSLVLYAAAACSPEVAKVLYKVLEDAMALVHKVCGCGGANWHDMTLIHKGCVPQNQNQYQPRPQVATASPPPLCMCMRL